MFGRATRQAWRSKTPTNQIGSQIATKPGQCVSVDQLESPTPGLIAQLKDIPTIQRYNAATVFVDHFSRLSYVHLQQSLSSEDTVCVKRAFERYCKSHGVRVLQYHADNGRFADTLFLRDITEQKQQLTYCSVNAHFQNGIAEKMIRNLQDATRATLLHAAACWPKVVTTNLWPYALRTANNVRNNTPTMSDTKSAAQVFTWTDGLPKPNTF